MNDRDRLEEGLRQLGAQAGVALALDPDGCCAIALDDGLACVVEADEARGLAHLHTELLRLGSARRAERLEQAMALNLFCNGTEGATLGLDRGTDSLVLYLGRRLDGLSGDDVVALIGEFVTLARRLRDEMQQAGTQGPEPEPNGPDGGPRMDFRFIA